MPGGRPAAGADQRSVPISIEARHLAMVDAVIAQMAGRAEYMLPVPAEAESRHLKAARRRQLLGRIIEEAFAPERREQVTIHADVYLPGATAAELEAATAEVRRWQRDEEDRLMADAPLLVRAAFSMARAHRLRSDPEAPIENAARAWAEAGELVRQWRTERSGDDD